MRRLTPYVLSILALAPLAPSMADVVINEIHYSPSPNNEAVEYIELHNTGPESVDLSGWKFTDGFAYIFPEDSALASGAYLILAQNEAEADESDGATGRAADAGSGPGALLRERPLGPAAYLGMALRCSFRSWIEVSTSPCSSQKVRSCAREAEATAQPRGESKGGPSRLGRGWRGFCENVWGVGCHKIIKQYKRHTGYLSARLDIYIYIYYTIQYII